MGKELEFWLETLKDARKQFMLARGTYMAIANDMMKCKQWLVEAKMLDETIPIPGGGTLIPFYEEMSFEQYQNVFEDPKMTLDVLAIRPFTEIEKIGKKTAKESKLMERYRYIYSSIDRGFRQNSKCLGSFKRELEDMQCQLSYLKNQILVYNKFRWNFYTEDVFDGNFFSPDLSIKNCSYIQFEQDKFQNKK